MAKKTKKPTPAPRKKPQPAKAKSKPSPKAKPAPKKASKPLSKSKPVSKSKSAPKAKPKAPAPKAKPSPKAKASTKPKAKAPKPTPKVVKKAPVKSSPKKAAKPAVKSAAAKKAPAAKAAPAAKTAKPAKAAPAPAPKATKPSADAAPVAKPVVASGKNKSRANLRSSILAKRGVKAAKPVAFSLDEVREIAKTAKQETGGTEIHAAQARAAAVKAKLAEAAAKPAAPNHIKTASLADILGFNPTAKKTTPHDDVSEVPEKFRRYYKLLLELRAHLTGQLDTHTEETLKRSSKDDTGDLSSYGQHMADAGTDTFDRDFALSLVSSEQEALSEVEAAIKRIKNGTYGICEVTGKPIARERLLAVPFTRHSAEAQKEIEKTRYRTRAQSGLFGEFGEEGATLSSGGDGDDD
ncbi:MAG: TraR/DksA C4-type zinc finger protein [Verrucomicrobiota bacterium]